MLRKYTKESNGDTGMLASADHLHAHKPEEGKTPKSIIGTF